MRQTHLFFRCSGDKPTEYRNSQGLRKSSVFVLFVLLISSFGMVSANEVKTDETSTDEVKADNIEEQTSADCTNPGYYDLSGVGAIVREMVTDLELEGAVLELTIENVTIMHCAWGEYTLNETVSIASASKWISGLLVMDAVDEGELSLDSRLGDHLDGLNDTTKENITLRELFSHTAGTVNGTTDRSNDRSTRRPAPPNTLEKSAHELMNLSLDHTPGTTFAYGGVSMHVAAHVVENATKGEWIELWNQRIGDPLGITSLVWNDHYPDTKNPNVAGGIKAITTNDYTKVLQMLVNKGFYNGIRILSADAVDMMLSNQSGPVNIGYLPTTVSSWDKGFLGYGIGNWISDVNDTGVPFEFNSAGAFGYTPWMDISRNLTGVLLVDGTNADVSPYWIRIRNAVREAVDHDYPVTILSTSPASELEFEELENGSRTFSIEAVDPEGKALQARWYLDGKKVADGGFDQRSHYNYTLHYNLDSVGRHDLQVLLNDGVNDVFHQWNFTITNVNLAPIIDSHYPIDKATINDTGEMIFTILAHDSYAGDTLEFRWYKDASLIEAANENSYTYIPVKGENGTSTIRVEISDGNGGLIEQEWELSVEPSETGGDPGGDGEGEPGDSSEKGEFPVISAILLGGVVMFVFILFALRYRQL